MISLQLVLSVLCKNISFVSFRARERLEIVGDEIPDLFVVWVIHAAQKNCCTN